MDSPDPMDANSRQCTAKSKQSGERCKRRPHPGASVCVIHGGGAKHVQTKARERLDALVLPAIESLHAAMRSDDIAATIRAAQIVLDRTGYGPTTKVDIGDPDGVLAAVLGVGKEELPE